MSNGTAIEEAPQPEAAEVPVDDAEVTCTQCGNTEPFGDCQWCPRCGFHPRFGTKLDVDEHRSWEEPPADWSEVVPPWSRVLAGGAVALVAAGLAARFLVPPEQRWVVTIGTATIGFVAFAVAHIAAYLAAAHVDEKLGVFDVLMKPLGVWRPTIKSLPKNVWRVWTGGWSATAILVALFVVGGIEWSTIFEKDWGFRKSAKPNLVHAVVEQAREEREGGADNLEDAINDFAGEADAEPEPPPTKSLVESADCVVIGYTTFGEDRIGKLLLATVYDGKLQFATAISFTSLPAEERQTLRERLPTLERSRPFVPAQYAATWLEPVIMCRVAFEKWTKEGRMVSPEFREMLADVKAP